MNATLKHHLMEFVEQEPRIVQEILNSMYVDDFSGGADDDERAYMHYTRIKDIMKEAGFTLRKWASNSKALVDQMKNEDFEEKATEMGECFVEDDAT